MIELITGETVEVCENCKYYVIDKLDPQGVGGYCGKDNDCPDDVFDVYIGLRDRR